MFIWIRTISSLSTFMSRLCPAKKHHKLHWMQADIQAQTDSLCFLKGRVQVHELITIFHQIIDQPVNLVLYSGHLFALYFSHSLSALNACCSFNLTNFARTSTRTLQTLKPQLCTGIETTNVHMMKPWPYGY